MNSFQIIQEQKKMLGNLDRWLGQAVEYAATKNFDPNVLCGARLAPDMFPLTRQVQPSCDTLPIDATYLTSEATPSHPDTEQTIAELRQRIATCLAFVDSVPADKYEGSSDKKVAPRVAQGKWVTGDEYHLEMAIPNFFFHVTTAYTILRHNGVPVGKRDYLGSMPFKD